MTGTQAPLISVITPTRDRPELLWRTIGSVMSQRLERWEMIVIDDGEGSGVETALGLGDERIVAFKNPGAGQVDARNAGIAAARGGTIHLLDDDDRWADAHHLERVLETLRARAGLVFRNGWLVLEEPAEGDWLERQRLAFDRPTTAASLRLDNTLLTSGVAYPKAFHDELGLFDRAMGNYWDWDWFLRVTEGYPLLAIPGPCVLMSWRGSNTSSDPSKPQRVAFLERLCAKHGLGPIASKNHYTVLVG